MSKKQNGCMSGSGIKDLHVRDDDADIVGYSGI